jgi:hypothetical protein
LTTITINTQTSLWTYSRKKFISSTHVF